MATTIAGDGKQASRYSNLQGGLGFYLGPTGNTLQGFYNMGTAATSGDVDGFNKAAAKLLPYQILKQITERVME